VRIEILTDRPAERFRPGTILYREGSEVPLTIRTAAAVEDGPGWRLTFREIADRTTAEALRGTFLEAEIGVTTLARGEYYWHEVIGAAVRDLSGADLGTVQDVYRVGETEVFAVGGGPRGDFDIPAVRAFIRVFAPRRGEIVVDADALELGPQPPGSTAAAGDRERPKAPRRRAGSRRKSPPVEPSTETGS
jgi:16S rRNA processing protein RimM